MDFGFTEEQELLRRSVAEFCESEITQEKVREWEETIDFLPQELWDKMAALGFFSMSVPQEYGGEGGDMVTAMVGLEEISKASTAGWAPPSGSGRGRWWSWAAKSRSGSSCRGSPAES